MKKYGPAVTDPAMQGPDRTDDTPQPDQDLASRSIAAAEAARMGTTVEDLERRAQPTGDQLPEVSRPKLGTAFEEELHDPVPQNAVQQPPEAPAFARYEDYETVVAALKEHGKHAQEGDSAAAAELNRIAEYEYGRPDGGRLPIKKRLNAYGVGKPVVESS